MTCLICLDREAVFTLYDCGHRDMCRTCANRVLDGSYVGWRCAKCRQPMVVVDWRVGDADDALVRAAVLLLHDPESQLAADNVPGVKRSLQQLRELLNEPMANASDVRPAYISRCKAATNILLCVANSLQEADGDTKDTEFTQEDAVHAGELLMWHLANRGHAMCCGNALADFLESDGELHSYIWCQPVDHLVDMGFAHEQSPPQESGGRRPPCPDGLLCKPTSQPRPFACR